MNATVAQRLVRILCTHCKSEVPFNSTEWPSELETPKIESQFKPIGCPHCNFSGFSGRRAIYEVIPVDREVSQLIKDNVYDVDEILRSKKIKRISDQAIQLFVSGETSLEEIYNLILS